MLYPSLHGFQRGNPFISLQLEPRSTWLYSPWIVPASGPRSRELTFAQTNAKSGTGPQILQVHVRNMRGRWAIAPSASANDTPGKPATFRLLKELGPISAIFDASCVDGVRWAKTRVSVRSKLRSPRFFGALHGAGCKNPDSTVRFRRWRAYRRFSCA
jgi:hypothetical protein